MAGVTVIIPCLNEAATIGSVVSDVLMQGVDAVIVVDNGSTDGTADVARRAGAQIIAQPTRGYGNACAAGVAAVTAPRAILCFMDGDGSDVPELLPELVLPVRAGTADFVMGSRLRGRREPGSLTPQQIFAARLAGVLLRLTYGVRFTDMSPLRAIRADCLASLGMREATYGWNLEMQMRAAAAGLRGLAIPADHRLRRGGQSKVSGNLVAGLSATWKISTTFLRLAIGLRRTTTALR